MTANSIIKIRPIDFHWETSNPFLFCAHHKDHFPPANDEMGPSTSLKGRNIGNDFVIKDGWRMYHGDKIPGFPVHPHRGFETVTVVLEGLVDHADSMGAAGRYGNGDVQWMTAGKGMQHSEMFPLLNKENDNPCELFQIWLNLPASKKFTEPHYKMFWAEEIPEYTYTDENNNKTLLKVITGKINEVSAPVPPPDSWAADPANEVAIWIISMQANAVWKIPQALQQVNRNLYFYNGSTVNIGEQNILPMHAIELNSNLNTEIINGDKPAQLLLLQGKPINEPVVPYGPFVMNTYEEIQQAFYDYQKTEFGGWPWPRRDQVHPKEQGRFARFTDGRVEEK